MWTETPERTISRMSVEAPGLVRFSSGRSSAVRTMSLSVSNSVRRYVLSRSQRAIWRSKRRDSLPPFYRSACSLATPNASMFLGIPAHPASSPRASGSQDPKPRRGHETLTGRPAAQKARASPSQRAGPEAHWAARATQAAPALPLEHVSPTAAQSVSRLWL